MKKFLFACTALLTLGSLQTQVSAQSQMATTPAPQLYFKTLPTNPEPQHKTNEAFDLELTSIDAPFSSCGLGNAEKVIVTVTNRGTTDTIKGFSLSYRVGSGAIDTEAVVKNLAPGASYQYTFSKTANLSAIQSYNITAATVFTDPVTSNNSKTATVTATHSAYLDSASITTGFETADDPSLFTVKNINGDSWTWQSDTRFSHSGKAAYSCYTSNTKKADDWLFTKCLELKKGVDYKVSFYYIVKNKNITTGRLFVMLGRQAVPASMTRQLFVDTAMDGTIYQQANFKFQVDEDGGYVMGIQDASVCSQATPANQGLYSVTIDDFNMIKDRNIAVLVSDIKYPRTDCDLANPSPIVVSLINRGTTDQSGFAVSLKVGSKTPITETYSQTLKAGESADYTFTATANNLNISGINKLQAYTNLSVKGEEFKQNVQKIDPADMSEDTAHFSNNFDSEDAMLGWDINDANLDGEKWSRGFESNPVPNYTMSFPSGGTFNNDADDWIFSSCATLEKGKAYSLVFDYNIAAVDAAAAPSFSITMGALQRPDAMTQELGTFDQASDGTDYVVGETIDCITPPETGTYYFGIHTEAPANSGVIRFDNFSLENSSCVVGVKKISKTDLARVYPNPANDQMTVALNLTATQDVTVSVVDILGKEIYKQVVKDASSEKVRIETADFSNGIYFVRVQSNNLSTVKKVIIKK